MWETKNCNTIHQNKKLLRGEATRTFLAVNKKETVICNVYRVDYKITVIEGWNVFLNIRIQLYFLIVNMVFIFVVRKIVVFSGKRPFK